MISSTTTAQTAFNSYGPDDQARIARAVATLESGGIPADEWIDLDYEEDGRRAWAFRRERVWVAFVESPLTVIHVSILSSFRYSEDS